MRFRTQTACVLKLRLFPPPSRGQGLRFLFLFLIEKGKKKIRQRDQSRARTTSHFQNACGLWVKSDRTKRTDSKRSALHPRANALVQWSHDHVPPEARLTLCSRLRGAREGRLRLQLDRVLQSWRLLQVLRWRWPTR